MKSIYSVAKTTKNGVRSCLLLTNCKEEAILFMNNKRKKARTSTFSLLEKKGKSFAFTTLI